MPKQILVASPHLAFGELLRLSLEESGQYRVRLVHSGAEASSSANRTIYSLLILDADLSDSPFAVLVKDIHAQQPQARLILIPPDNDPKHPTLQDLNADAFLSKPFYLPDLLETVAQLLDSPAAMPDVSPTPAPAKKPARNEKAVEAVQTNPPAAERPDWLNNTPALQQLLDDAAKEARVHAAFILTEGQVKQSSDGLPPAALQELATVLARTWEHHKNSDQARFVRLNEGGEYLLYATSLADQVALALACDVTMPLTRARARTTQLAKQLAEIPPPPPAPEEEDLSLEDGEVEAPDPRLLEMLADAPSPDPEPQPAPIERNVGSDWVPETAAETSPMPLNLPWEQILAQSRPPDKVVYPSDAPTIAIHRQPVASDATTVAIRPQEAAAGMEDTPPNTAEELEPPPPILPPSSVPLETVLKDSAQQPFFVPPQGTLLSVEPVSPTLSHLTYSALLLPRFPQHALVGELSEELGLWVPQLCLAFGWRLEGFSIRPDTLQFTLQVAPSVSPGNVVRILRQRTSQRIFSRFPELRDLNPSGDFWAPGYLIISGSTPPQPNLLHDFVAQTRRRQGLPAN